MGISLMLHSVRLGSRRRADEDEDDEEYSPDPAEALTESEKQAVRALLGGARPMRRTFYRVETPDGPVTLQAPGLQGPETCHYIRLRMRSVAPGTMTLLFELMRAGNLFMVTNFAQRDLVAVSEEQAQAMAGRLPEPPRVCPSPADLQGWLAEKVEACRRVRPERFEYDENDLMEDADAAALTLLADRAAGEREFERLLTAHPDDGSLYFVRGRAYEALGEKGLAADNYRKADELLPPGEDLVRAAARKGLARVMS
jgi:hypothetical protein